MDEQEKKNNQLLCTFTKRKFISDCIIDIKNKYIVLNNKVFQFYNEKNPDECYLTYNILKKDYDGLLKNTISVHRKNKTNTIYTINALNKLIMDENEGVLDKHFVINWELYKDTLILTNDEFIKLTPLKFEQLFNI